MKKILNKNLYMNYQSEYSPDDIHHIAFKTTNYKKMVDFYTNLFGCEPLYQSDLIDNFHGKNRSEFLNYILKEIEQRN